MSSALTAAQVDDIEFWRDLQPELSIEADREVPRFAVADPDELLARIRSEGYVRVPDVVPDGSV